MVGQVSLASYGAVNISQDQEIFELKRKLEMAQMSKILFNRIGR